MRSFHYVVSAMLATFSVAEAKAETSGFLEVQSLANFDPIAQKKIVDGGLSRDFNDTFGFSSFFLITKGWAEAYAGPTWKPYRKLNLGLSAGVEQCGTSLGARYEVSLWSLVGPVTFLGFLEANNETFQGDDSGIWYKVNITANATGPLFLGTELRRGYGVGPLAQWKIGPMKSWIAWTPWNPETHETHSAVVLSGIAFNI
jgi:hypothetical protein